MTEMRCLVHLVTLVCALHSSYCEGTSITLSPLGMVSVCPGGQVPLTCEITPGSGFLYWTVSVPNLGTGRRIIADVGDFSPNLLFSGLHSTVFAITRTSVNPFTSQMMVNNVTTEINGSTIYCSEDGNENGAPMVTIIVTNEDHSLNVSLVNQLLRNSNVTVTLQWLQETREIYHVSVFPVTSHADLTSDLMTVSINLTLSYNIQYNISIVSNLCGITTTKILNYVTCDDPPTHRPVVVVTGSQDSHPLIEGQVITYTCPSGFIPTGPNASVCTGNGEWEPDPGEVDCIEMSSSSPPVTEAESGTTTNLIAVFSSIIAIVCVVMIRLN